MKKEILLGRDTVTKLFHSQSEIFELKKNFTGSITPELIE